ncbi:MAG: ABC transporter permease [Acidobacteria bacterium]|nr:MAG: ABC transporter permease [Acidobacteriota bacterium]
MPEWGEDLRSRLAQLRLSPAREAEIIEELSQHLDQRYDELREGGASDTEARRLAIEELLEPGALAYFMRSLRQANVPTPVAVGAPRRLPVFDLWQDLRYAVRTLRKQPSFTAAAVLTLALGIGVNSAIFGLVDTILLRPLPLPDPDRLVMVWERTSTSLRGIVSPRNLIEWNRRNRTFEMIAGFRPNVGAMVMGNSDGTAENVPRQWVTAGIFDTLGVRAIAGRTFLPSDDADRANVVVLSEGFWRARFNADPKVIGRNVRLDGEQWTVVGVVPNEALLLGQTSIWALMPIQGGRGSLVLTIGRLKPGVTIEAANADMAAVAQGLAREFPNTNAGRGVTIAPLRDVAIGSDLRQTSMLFLGVVGFVLLICCANVANLLLARATVRKRELAIRSALGADRRRVIRQLLTESLVLAVIGGALGLALGAGILHIAPSVIPQGLLPTGLALTFDAQVIAFCAVTALLVGLLFGLIPAWQATQFSSADVIAPGSRTVTGRGGRIRYVLVAGQVATAVVLLFGAGLLLRTLLAIESVDRGYRAESALTMIVDPGAGHPNEAALRQFYEAAAQEIMALPGVRGVAWATTLPLGRSYQGSSFFEIVGDPPLAESQRPAADYQIVSPAYFTAVDLPIVTGRGFDEHDVAGKVQVCMVNEAFVRRYLQGRSPIGVKVAIRRTPSAQSPSVVREIVGVARQVKGRPNEAEDLIQIYVPLAQDTPGDIFMIVRPASGRAEALAPAVRAAMARVDKQQLVSVRDPMTLDDVVWAATARHRFRAVLVMAFAGLALLLAMVGLFGVLTYSVQQRVRDFGVRRALGATAGDVLWLVARSATGVMAAGTVLGLALAAVSGRLLATMLFGVQPSDPATFAFVAVVLALTVAVSTIGPAWRATRIDPAVTLRQE